MSLFIKGDITIEELQSAILMFKGHEIIELPDHGDLIDMDKLIDDMKMVFGEETLVTMLMRTNGFKSTVKTVPKEHAFECFCNLTEFVKLQPVVIPSERSEE